MTVRGALLGLGLAGIIATSTQAQSSRADSITNLQNTLRAVGSRLYEKTSATDSVVVGFALGTPSFGDETRDKTSYLVIARPPNFLVACSALQETQRKTGAYFFLPTGVLSKWMVVGRTEGDWKLPFYMAITNGNEMIYDLSAEHPFEGGFSQVTEYTPHTAFTLEFSHGEVPKATKTVGPTEDVEADALSCLAVVTGGATAYRDALMHR